MTKAVWLAVVLAALPACATNPATGQRELSLMNENQEIQTGQEMDAEVRREMGVYDDRELQQYVEGIGLKLAASSERPNLPWRFTVVDVPAVNAFALPGGYIYITRGILPYLDNEAQLAGVLGHEIGHVTARHAARQYTRTTGAELGMLFGSLFVPAARPVAGLGESGFGVLNLKYGRDDELQADSLGVRYAAKAGWDPDAVPNMLRTLGRIDEVSDNKGVPNWLSTHPAPDDRVARVQDVVQQLPVSEAPSASNHDVYLRHVDRLVYGDNPEQGIVRGRTFLHPNLRFAVDFPDGWDVRNGQTEVVAKEPNTSAVVVLALLSRPQGRDLEEVARVSMRGPGLQPIDGDRRTINGLEAYVGTYEGSLSGLGRVTVRAAHLEQGRNVFRVAGIAPSASYERVAPAFDTSIQSFRPMTRSEAEGIQPNRIALYTARAGDTWQALAAHQGNGAVKASILAIMNGHAVNEQPRSGERLKIVAVG